MAFVHDATARRCEFCGTPEGRWVQSGYCCEADRDDRREKTVQDAVAMLVDLGYTVTPPPDPTP